MAENKNPIVTFEMENGDIFKAELLPEYAPNTVNSFIDLINKGFYDGIIFHRVIPGFVIQGGDTHGICIGFPCYAIKGEFAQNGFPQNTLKHDAGVLSMARAMSPNSGGSQFFVCDDDAYFLDGAYAGFGRVIEGMEVVHAIANVPRDGADKPFEDQKMKKVTVETFGVEYPEPEKL